MIHKLDYVVEYIRGDSMHVLLQLGVLFGVCLLGELISALLPFPFPGSVISMLLLFFLLVTKFLKAQQITDVASFFQKNMAFFFLPASVAIIQNLGMLKEIWIQFFAVCIISTIITFVITAWTVKAVIALQKFFVKKKSK